MWRFVLPCSSFTASLAVRMSSLLSCMAGCIISTLGSRTAGRARREETAEWSKDKRAIETDVWTKNRKVVVCSRGLSCHVGEMRGAIHASRGWVRC